MKKTIKSSCFSLVLSFVITVSLVGVPAYAQGDKTSEIDKIFSWSKTYEPGCAVAVSQNGKQIVNRAYGSADIERDVQLSSNTIFDAGSVQKQFVAASVLLLVEDGKLSLTEDIHKYIPELPDYGQKITLDHLLTHTGGIRDWTGLGALTGRQVDALTLTLRQRGLDFAPGEEWSYSNSGFVLLKEIVARTSGMSLDEFTRKRLFEPLGMKNTSYRTDLREVVKNRALAYRKEKDGWRMDFGLGNDRGGGGAMLSTPSDLLIWNEALTTNRLGKFVTEKLQEPAELNNDRKLGYARGLFIMETNAGEKMVWHSGGAAGYSTWLGRIPGRGLSVAVMCNVEPISSTQLADRIIDQFLPPNGAATTQAMPPIAAEGLDPAGLDLNSKAGLYFNENTGEPLQLIVDRGRLRVADGPALVAQSKDRFKRLGNALMFMSGDEFELRFRSPNELELKSMEGKTSRYRRAQKYAPTTDELKAFTGRFTNDETRAFFEMSPGKEGLMIRLNDSRAFEFKPVDRDTFQLGGMILRFRRDKDGKIVGFDYSNPLVRNIKFTLLNECKS
ncbi:MAG TPA: serine hydrolase domain-containing protein [Pyrinomonadaceae bacterium]|jgi:CubicO group peptidase (beta-lactamase class C family)